MTNTRPPFKKIADFAILGMALSIPSGFYFLTLPLLILLAICRLCQKDWLWEPSAFKQPAFFFPAALYLYIVIQAFFSHDKGEALSTLSTKLPFLLYPLVLGTYQRIDKDLVRRAERCFLFSVCLSLIAALVYAFFDETFSHQHSVVLGQAPYNKFSSYGLTRVFNDWHPTVVAMSAVQAIFILIRHYGDRLRPKKLPSLILPALVFLLLTISLFLLNSMTALIAFVTILLYCTFIFLGRQGISAGARIGFICLLLGCAAAFMYFNPLKMEKIELLKHRDLKATDHYEERNVLTMRMAKWETHLGIARDHLPWGTTEGDIKHIRHEAYLAADFQDLALHNYNAHDQFLEYLAIYGIPGILLFLGMLWAPFPNTAYRTSYLAFIVITCLIFLTESLLERQQGLNYFMFFYALYARRDPASGGEDGTRRSFAASSWSTLTRLVFILLAAIAIYQFLHDRSLWLDEAMLALNIVEKSFTGLLQPLDHSQVAPVLFLFIEKASTRIFGNSEMALRLFPLICSILALVLAYYACLALTKNKYIAGTACCLLGITPKFIYYASEVKQYATDLTVLLAIYLVAFSENAFVQRYRLVLLALTGAAAIFISNIAVIPLCTVGTWLLYQAIRQGKDRTAVFAALPLWAICFAINYKLFIWHHPTAKIMKEYWRESFMPGNPAGTAGRHWIGSRIHQVFYELLPGIAGFETLTILLYLGGLLYLLKAKRYRLLYLSVAPIALHLLLSALKMYPFDLRLILYQLPLYIIVLAGGLYGLTTLLTRKPAYVLALSGLCTVAFSLRLFRLLPMNNEEIRPVIASMNRYVQPGESTYIYYGGRHAFNYYKETGRVLFSGIPTLYGNSHPGDWPGYAKELRDVKGHVWLVFSHVYPFDGSRGEERSMINELQQRGHILRTFEAYNSAAYLMDLW
ncbi:O-antigen ligase family protein [Flavitalea sp. BT771]|uniref:O-antigen ligase family protein n=1 Tax=Flavitalea sp. BT771 TaxID=3063329 RepID=UPI0026E13A1D|nr:O-antigen ligase family protein [Flavitalea sp. BT771]MDO6435549.1 O-antigen ligase family protein [Flavitalea sp. BT771]MDV6224449.1 O-antigen ligase family protein [Flavitalea sp. BT771]